MNLGRGLVLVLVLCFFSSIFFPAAAEYAIVSIYDGAGATKVSWATMSTGSGGECGRPYGDPQSGTSSCNYYYNYGKQYSVEGNWEARINVLTFYCSKSSSCPNGGAALMCPGGVGDCPSGAGCTCSANYCINCNSCDSPHPYTCNIGEDSGRFTLWNINWDGRQGDCEGYGKIWEDDFEGGLSANCCGDDSGEHMKLCIDMSGQGSCGGDTTACCNADADCVDQNQVCRTSGACYGSSVFGNSYCGASSTWQDPDGSSSYCPGSCGTWVASESKCCGDDGTSDDFCVTGEQSACVDGTYYSNTDTSSTACSQCGNNWEDDFETGTPNCCGDDSGESYETCERQANEPLPGGSDVCVASSDDTACCDTDQDCVYNGVCTAEGTHTDIDSDGITEYCRDGTWREGISPDYISFDVTGCTYKDTGGSVCWVKQSTTFYPEIRHYDKDSTPYRQYLTFNNGCSPNGCGGPPDEIKSYGSVDVGEGQAISITDWMADDDYLDISAAQCTESGGCTGDYAKVKWTVSTAAAVGEIDRDIWTYLYDQALNGRGYTNTGWDMKVDNTAPGNVPSFTSPAVNAIVSTTPTLNWGDASDSRSGIGNYNIQVDDDSGFGSMAVNTNVGSSTSQYTVPGATLSECTTYYWRVQSVDHVGYTGSWVGGASRYFRTTHSNPDSCQYVCTEQYGYDWFSSVSGGSNSPCCGDDGGSDDFYYYSANPATATSLQCTRCLNAVKAGPTTLHGNGYWGGTSPTTDQSGTCYYGDITCTASSASNGASTTRYGNGYWTGTTCYYGDISCADGSSANGASGSTLCSSGTSQCCPDQGHRAEGVSCNDGSIGGTSYDKDTSQARCEDGSSSGCTAYTWMSSASACCGDDGGEDFENSGAGNSCCINGVVVSNNSTDTTEQFLCLDGQIYGCMGGSGAGGETIDSACTRRDGWYCDDTPTDKWTAQIAGGGTPDDCDGAGTEYPYGSGETSTQYDKETCVGNAMWDDRGNGPSNQDQGYQCLDVAWYGPYIGYCTLSQSGSGDDFMTVTAYWETADETPDTYSNTGHHRWRIDNDGSGTGACNYGTNGCYYDTGLVNGCDNVDANEGTYGDYYSEDIQWSEFDTSPSAETTYYLEIGEEECGSAQITAEEDPNDNEGSCTATGTLCVPPGYYADTDSDCCPNGATTGTYPGKDDDGGNCVKCSSTLQLLGGTGNNVCEQKCGAAAGCDEIAQNECPNNQYICTSSCAYTDRDASEAYCEDGTGCTAFIWTGANCCGDDGAETFVDAADTDMLCYQGTTYSCNSPDTKDGDVDRLACAKVGAYYCTASGWSMTPPDADSCINGCEAAGGIWFGGDLEEGCCESGEEFISEKVIEDGLRAYFKFDESPGVNKTNDNQGGFVGDIYDATIVTSSSEVVSGNALSFDGDNDYVLVPDSETLNISGEITLSAWIKPTSVSTTQFVISKDRDCCDSPGKGGYDLRINSDGSVRGCIWRESTTSTLCAAGGSLTADEWQQVAMTFDGSQVRVYLNGRHVGTSATVSDSIQLSTKDLTLGVLSYNHPAYYDYGGVMDEVMVWNRSLDDDEMAVLYRQFPEYPQDDVELYWPLDEGEGTAAGDDSSNNRNGLITQGSWASGKIGDGVRFNGVQDGDISVSLGKMSTPFTIALWANRNGTISYANGFAGIMGWRYGSELLQGVVLQSGNVIYYHDYQGSPSSISTGQSMQVGKWYHLAVVHDGTSVKVYVDGQALVDQAQTLSGDSSSELQVGGLIWTTGSNREFNGVVDDVRVYSRALNESEINYLHGAENWRKYGCDNGQLTGCGDGDDCVKNIAESGMTYYCYDEYFTDYRDVVDDCPNACTEQGGTWIAGGGDKNCCISSGEFWCNESTGVDKLCYGGIVYPCDYWCDVFGEVESTGYTCTPSADGDCTSSTSCDGDDCECLKSEGTTCTWDYECSEDNCLSYSQGTPADASLGSMSGSLGGSVCCPPGSCSFDQDVNGYVDSCAVNTSTSIDTDGDNDLDYCFDGQWRECKDYLAENGKASDCTCLGTSVAVNKSGTWVCRDPPVSFTYDTDMSCGTACDSDSDLNNVELLDMNGQCTVFDTECSNVLQEAWWEGNTSLLAVHVVANCPCGESADCNVSVESNGERASKSFLAPDGQNVSATLEPNFAYGDNNVSISCSCSQFPTVCWDNSYATVSGAASIPETECVAGKACSLTVNVSNIGAVGANMKPYMGVSKGSQARMNSSSYFVTAGDYHVFVYTDTYACSWHDATWETVDGKLQLSMVANVELTDLAYNFSTNRSGYLAQCQSASDCTTCCSGYWWCWLNSSQEGDFACSAGVCCPTGEHFQEGACCLSSEKCCLDDGSCNTGEWCDNYTTGMPEGNFFCRDKKDLGYTCQQDRECSSGYCGGGICADPEPVTLQEWFECKPYQSNDYCSYQSVSGTYVFDPKGCNVDGDCDGSYYCYLPRRACLECAVASTTYAGLNVSDDGLCPSVSCIGYDLDCCESDGDCQSAEWCDASASCTACSTRSDGVCSSSACIGTDPDCCSTSEDCGEGLSCVYNTCTGNVGQACSGDGQCTGGLKCLGGVCSKETFMVLSPEEDPYDANLGETLKLTLIVSDPQNRQDQYRVWVDQSFIPDSAFVEIDGEKSETFEMGAGEVRKFLVTVAAARVTEGTPDISTQIRVGSESNSYVNDNVAINVEVTPVTTSNVPSAPLGAWAWVLILGYVIGMITPR